MEFQTHEQAKQFLRENYKGGCECPTCHQFVKEYKRLITASSAHGLINLYNKADGQIDVYFHTDRFLDRKQWADFSKLRYWGLIRSKTSGGGSTASSGYWALTTTGVNFVRNRVSVMKYSHIYNGRLTGQTGEPVNIIDCLKNKFDYAKLMKCSSEETTFKS